MRQIKFRAWNVRSKTMLDVNKVVWDTEGRVYVLDDETGNPFSETILMQFTGLLDKSGKEIYEGDVLDFPHKLKHEDGAVKWIGNGFWLETLAEVNNHHWPNEEICEIIGDIYSNPELVEK